MPRLATLLILVWLAFPAAAASPIVIVLSWDGTRHDYPERGPTPALDRMQRDGVRAERLIPAFPPNTFPAHVTLATGASVGVHGIVGNRFTDRERGRFRYSNDASWILAEPIWIAAERQNVRAATFFWVGSETDWNGTRASYRQAPFDARVPESQKVDRIVEWLDLPEAERPGLIMSWWHGCDHVAHEKGPEHADVAVQLQAQDAQLGRLIAAIDARGLWELATLLVVSDHGMTEATRTVEVERALDAAGISGRLEAGGGVGYVHLRRPADLERALQVLGSLEGVRAYASPAVPARWRSHHPARSGDITLLVEPPWSLSRISRTRGWPWPLRWLTRRKALRGMHGYRTDHADMGAIFYAMGRGVPAGRVLGPVRAVDLAATIAWSLGIEPPFQSEGRGILNGAPGESGAIDGAGPEAR